MVFYLFMYRLNEVMDLWSKVIEYLFVGWVVLLLWYLTDSLSSLDNTTQHFWCVSKQILQLNMLKERIFTYFSPH